MQTSKMKRWIRDLKSVKEQGLQNLEEKTGNARWKWNLMNVPRKKEVIKWLWWLLAVLQMEQNQLVPVVGSKWSRTKLFQWLFSVLQMEQNQVVLVVVFSPSNGAEPSGSGGCFQSFKWSRTKWFGWLLTVLQMEQNQVVLENLANKGSPKEHLDREDTTANKRKKSKKWNWKILK